MVYRRTFREIVARVAQSNGLSLAKRARIANACAHTIPTAASTFYSIKHNVLSQLLSAKELGASVVQVEPRRQGPHLLVRLPDGVQLHAPATRLSRVALQNAQGLKEVSVMS
jgi:hypothetical protein